MKTAKKILRKDLIEKARRLGYRGVSKLRKDELIELIAVKKKSQKRKKSPKKKKSTKDKDKYERCVQEVKAKQSDWCRKRGYPAYAVDPQGKKCYK